MNADHHRTLRRYLLHQLAEDEAAKVEERIFTADAFHQLAEAVEDELYDEFTRV